MQPAPSLRTSAQVRPRLRVSCYTVTVLKFLIVIFELVVLEVTSEGKMELGTSAPK